MANISAADIKRLRELTGAGMTDCKKALVESDGDVDKAIELLRLKGAKDVNKRQERATANGLVASRLDGTASGVLVELNCETDFVAKTEQFQQLGAALADVVAETGVTDVESLLAAPLDGKTVQQRVEEASAALGEKFQVRRIASLGGDGRFVYQYLHKTDPDLPAQVGVLVELDQDVPEVGKDVAQHIAALAPRYLTSDDIPAEDVERERRLAEQITRDEGKPEPAIAKIVEGRVNAFFKDVVLVDQVHVKDGKKQVKAVLADAGVGVTGFARFRVGQA